MFSFSLGMKKLLVLVSTCTANACACAVNNLVWNSTLILRVIIDYNIDHRHIFVFKNIGFYKSSFLRLFSYPNFTEKNLHVFVPVFVPYLRI